MQRFCRTNNSYKESNKASNWFSENNMFTNPDKSKSIVAQKNQVLNKLTHFMIGNLVSRYWVFSEAVRNQYWQSTKFHISTHQYLSAPLNLQLNALGRLKNPGFKAKKVLIVTFILPNFSYCTLAGIASSTKLLKKAENLQKKSS